MGEEQNPTPSDGGAAVAPVAPSDVVSKAEYDRLQSQYAGAQGHGAKEKKRADELSSRIDLVTADYEGKLTTVVTERDTFRTQAQAKELELEQARRELSELKRGKVVADKLAAKEEYAPLAKLYAKGLLPLASVPDDQLDAMLDGLAAELTGVQHSAVRDAMTGFTPAPPPSGDPRGAQKTAEEWMEEALHLPIGSKEHSAAMNAYMDALRRQKK